MALESGKLRHRIQVQRKLESRDPESGDVIVRWVDFAKLWANVEPVSVREFLSSRATQSEIVARITVRYRDDLLPTMRIQYRGKIYNPEGWLPDKESGLEYMTAPCSAGVNDGR